MSNHPPVRDVWPAPRDLSAPRPRYRLQDRPRVGASSQRRGLTTALVYRRVATTRLSLWPSLSHSAVGSVARNTLPVSPHGTAATPPDRRVSRLPFPPPSATHGLDDLGLALPLRAACRFPAPLDFSIGPFRSLPVRKIKPIRVLLYCSRLNWLIPAIHRRSFFVKKIRGLKMHSWTVCRRLAAQPKKARAIRLAAVFLSLSWPYAKLR